MTPLTLQQAFIASILSALIVYSTRLLPFVIFGHRKPPLIIGFIEQYIPSLIIAVLIVYCFKDVNFTSFSISAPYFIACGFVVLMHLLFRNSLLSIGGGTVLFMILSRVM